jgi:hypothetical protein
MRKSVRVLNASANVKRFMPSLCMVYLQVGAGKYPQGEWSHAPGRRVKKN